ncbi:glycosyltransferase family 2 protein [Nonlabens sp.]|uniref:glycosyltransferase family 2 protein n=1 Tax=Nonlabens sp. TaxID=1888209 RepID=UPI003F69CF39
MISISIITINYNNAVGLERTIKSVQEQTAVDYEHIIIDGNSTDGSKELIELCKEQFSYWVSEPDKGIYHAMNKGIKAASGDYLLFLNSGDYFFKPNSVKILHDHAIETNFPVFVYGNIEVNGNDKWIKKYSSILNLEYFITESIPHPATIILKDRFQNNLYDSKLKIVADWKFFLIEIGVKKASYSHVDMVISVFHLDGISSTSSKLLISERKKVILKYAPQFIRNHLQHFEKNDSKNKFNKVIKRILLSILKR